MYWTSSEYVNILHYHDNKIRLIRVDIFPPAVARDVRFKNHFHLFSYITCITNKNITISENIKSDLNHWSKKTYFFTGIICSWLVLLFQCNRSMLSAGTIESRRRVVLWSRHLFVNNVQNANVRLGGKVEMIT